MTCAVFSMLKYFHHILKFRESLKSIWFLSFDSPRNHPDKATLAQPMPLVLDRTVWPMAYRKYIPMECSGNLFETQHFYLFSGTSCAEMTHLTFNSIIRAKQHFKQKIFWIHGGLPAELNCSLSCISAKERRSLFFPILS